MTRFVTDPRDREQAYREVLEGVAELAGQPLLSAQARAVLERNEIPSAHDRAERLETALRSAADRLEWLAEARLRFRDLDQVGDYARPAWERAMGVLHGGAS